jgi:Protein of unknown function (DUF4236)
MLGSSPYTRWGAQRKTMGFRFQKRISLLPGIRLNLSKSGASVTVGKPGLSVNLGKDGATGNVGIPGTGLSYREKLAGNPTTVPDQEPVQSEKLVQPNASSAGIWKWLFFAAVVVIIVLLAARG